MDNKQTIVKVEKGIDVGSAPDELIRLALTGGADLEKLEKLLTIRERYEANEALKAYNEAMSAFKSNPPKIDKDRTVAYGTTKYNHASLANVCEKINEGLSKVGLSASWTVKQNGAVSVTCKITHVKGHSEETTLTAPADTSGSKNAIQAIGSTISYLERYTILALTGLATQDMDDDGIASGRADEVISDKQKSQLVDMIADCGADIPKFCAYMKVEELDQIHAADFNKAVLALESKKNGKKVKEVAK